MWKCGVNRKIRQAQPKGLCLQPLARNLSKTRAFPTLFKHPDSWTFSTNYNMKNVKHQATIPYIKKTQLNSQKWERISPSLILNLSFYQCSGSKYSQHMQYKWKVRTCITSGPWIEHFSFTRYFLFQNKNTFRTYTFQTKFSTNTSYTLEDRHKS